jgi:hypothetical protein
MRKPRPTPAAMTMGMASDEGLKTMERKREV